MALHCSAILSASKLFFSWLFYSVLRDQFLNISVGIASRSTYGLVGYYVTSSWRPIHCRHATVPLFNAESSSASIRKMKREISVRRNTLGSEFDGCKNYTSSVPMVSNSGPDIYKGWLDFVLTPRENTVVHFAII